MTLLVQSLQDTRLADARRIGRKAAACGELLGAGFQAPQGVCLSVEAFQLALRESSLSLETVLQSRPQMDPLEAARIVSNPRTPLSALEVPVAILEQLEAALAACGLTNQRLAVRSSGVNEDLPGSSMAGRFRSVLGVQGMPALRNAILTCWRSAFEGPTLSGQVKIENTEDLEMGVLIQPLIEADCSGVCFSRDPIRPKRERALVSAAWGLGVGVVEGNIPSDSAWVNRLDFAIEETLTSEKSIRSRSRRAARRSWKRSKRSSNGRPVCRLPGWSESCKPAWPPKRSLAALRT